MDRPLILPVLLLGLLACGDDPGYPWIDELTTSQLTSAANSVSADVIGGVAIAIASGSSFGAIPLECGTLSGSLTVGGEPVDSDEDGIPNDVTVTFDDAACWGDATHLTGWQRVRDPGAGAGFDYSEDLLYTSESSLEFRHLNSRKVRFHGTSTTGSFDHLIQHIDGSDPARPMEEYGTKATFTLTALGGTTLDPGEMGAGGLTYEGTIFQKDAIGPEGPDWKFSVETVLQHAIDPGCESYATSGLMVARLNGSGPAQFSRSWVVCGPGTLSVEGGVD